MLLLKMVDLGLANRSFMDGTVEDFTPFELHEQDIYLYFADTS